MSRWKIKRNRKAKQKKRERPDQNLNPEPEPDQGPPIESITMGMPGSLFRTTINQVSPADVPVLARYFKAHKLLPRNYIFDPTETRYRRIVTMAVDLLRDPKAKKTSRARAIVILGHSPCPIALRTLEVLATSDQPQADLARMGLNECLELAEQLPPNLVEDADSSAAGTMN